MTAFSYTALDQKGKEKKGVLEADTPKQVRQRLREQGFSPIKVDIVKEQVGRRAGKGKALKPGRAAMTVKELAMMTRQLATLLRAGMPLDATLSAVSEQADKPRIKSLLLAVRARVMEGMPLSAGMRQFPRTFSDYYCATVSAGEQSGHLDQVLERLADYTEQQMMMRQKITQASIYPLMMTVISLLIVVFLLVFVVPRFVTVFSDTGQELPALTQMLIGVSDTLQAYGIYMLVALLLAGIMFRRMMKKEAFRRRVHYFLLRLPLIGHMIKTVNTARFARTFGTLTEAGEPAVAAIQLSVQVIMNMPIREAVIDAANRVREGASLQHSLKQTGYFSPMTIHLIASGEASGKLDEMLGRAADNQDRETEGLIGTLLSLFEPALIIFMGGVILIIVLAILLPIFELNQAIG